MDKEIKTKWIKALRSGKYKQGKGFLHNLTDNTWCCLGVLCDTLPDVKREKVYEDIVVEEFDNSAATLTNGMLNWLTKNELMKMNDILCLDFNKIADYIEEHL